MSVRSGAMPKFRGGTTTAQTLPRHQDESADDIQDRNKDNVPFSCDKQHSAKIWRHWLIYRHTILSTGWRIWVLLFVLASLAARYSLSNQTSPGGEFYMVKKPIFRTPRVVWLDGNMVTDIKVKVSEPPNNHPLRYRRDVKMIIKENDPESSSFYNGNKLKSIADETGCPLIAEWQEGAFPKQTCNIQHEIPLEFRTNQELFLETIDSGAYKDVWRIRTQGQPVQAVVKTTVYDREVTPKDLERHQRDALVMEAASASAYVLNIYSYCSSSSATEAALGTLDDWLKSFYPNGETKYNPNYHPEAKVLLSVANKIANGVVDAQLYTKEGLPTYAHADLKSSQFLLTSTSDDPNHPVLKLNDFNRGRFLSAKNGTICPFYISSRHRGSTMRAPEEYARRGPQTDKIDVFALGSLFYLLLTFMSPFEDLEYKDAIDSILKGNEPSLPKDMETTKDPILQLLVNMMKACRRFKANDRPNSKQVVDMLKEGSSHL